jgi:WD40 repeat protein
LAIDNTGTILVSGSYDTSCIIWQVIKIDGTSVNLDPTPINILYGHSKAVTSVDISLELDMVISGSEDGTINIHTIYKGNFVRTLFLEKESLLKNTYINLKLSNERYILVYMKTILLDFSNKEQRTANQVINFFF